MEIVDLGVALDIPVDIPTDKVWQVFMIKVQQPNLFLPVTDVYCRPSDDGKGTYREMTQGPNRIIENIYAN